MILEAAQEWLTERGEECAPEPKGRWLDLPQRKLRVYLLGDELSLVDVGDPNDRARAAVITNPRLAAMVAHFRPGPVPTPN